MSDAEYMLDGFEDMAKSDIQGGIVSWSFGDNVFVVTANVGSFQTRNDLVGAGWTTRVMGQVTLARRDIGGYVFLSGTDITVSDITNQNRKCTVDNVRDCGPLVILELVDENEGA